MECIADNRTGNFSECNGEKFETVEEPRFEDEAYMVEAWESLTSGKGNKPIMDT